MFGAVIPAHGRNKAIQRLWQIAITDVVKYVFGAVAFAEFFVALLIHNVWHVGKFRKRFALMLRGHVKSERLVEC